MQLLQMLLGRFFLLKFVIKNEDIALSLGFSITVCHHSEGIAKILGGRVFFFGLIFIQQ
jgi:hypothetical protein